MRTSPLYENEKKNDVAHPNLKRDELKKIKYTFCDVVCLLHNLKVGILDVSASILEQSCQPLIIEYMPPF